MSAKSMGQWVKPVAKEPAECSPRRLLVVVGFDGSAVRLSSTRRGNATDLGPSREHRRRLCRPPVSGRGALARGNG